MKKKAWIRILLFGLMTWLVPFLISFMFYKPGGELVVSLGLFKTIMILVGAATGLYLLYQIYKNGPPIPRAGVIVGAVWFGINVVLDLAVLLPLTHMSLAAYWSDIGLRYLLIPMMSITLDKLAVAQTR